MAYDKETKIYDAITDLPDDMIEEAHNCVPEKSSQVKGQTGPDSMRRRTLIRGLITVAAVLLIAGGIAALISIVARNERDNIVEGHHQIAVISESKTDEPIRESESESQAAGDNSESAPQDIREDIPVDKPLLLARNFVAAEESLSGGGDIGMRVVINDFMSDQMAASGGVPGLIQTDEEDWDTEPVFTELPVFTNGAYDPDNHMGFPYGLSEAEMNALAQDAAARLAISFGEPYVPDWVRIINDPRYFVCADADDGSHLEVRANGTIVYSPVWDRGRVLPLPEEYQLDFYENPKEKVIATLKYLLDRYAEFISFDDPQIALNGTVDEDGIFRGDYYIYESSRDEKTKLLNYALKTARFSVVNGGLLSISVSDGMTGAEYVEDYPIKSAGEAADDLLAGRFYSSYFNTFEIRDKTQIGRAVLTYRTGPFDSYIMPYYLFYVDVSGQFDASDYMEIREGEKAYALYYVPAVRSEYVEMEQERSPYGPVGIDALTEEEADSITFEITEGSLSANGAEISVSNGSGMTIYYHKGYTISKFENGSWKELELLDTSAARAFLSDSLKVLNPGISYTNKVDWSDIYGRLPSGRYRLTKQVEGSPYPETEAENWFHKEGELTVEFEIP